MTTPVRNPTPEIPTPYAYTPKKGDAKNIVRWARVGLTVLLIPAGLGAFRDEIGQVPLVSGINLAIHEFGHYLFMPFGETMMYLGGSLFQVIVPLVFVWYFLFGRLEHRDKHAATICLWWTSINLLGVSIYAADARARQLMLISGATGEDDPDGHDFFNAFTNLGVLERDTIYAGRLRSLAGLLFFISIAAGLWAAWNSGKRSHPEEQRDEGASNRP